MFLNKDNILDITTGLNKALSTQEGTMTQYQALLHDTQAWCLLVNEFFSNHPIIFVT